MIRPHADDYRPPRDCRPTLLAVVGAVVLVLGLVWLAVGLFSWLLR